LKRKTGLFKLSNLFNLNLYTKGLKILTYVVICPHGISQHIVTLIPSAVVVRGGDAGKAGALSNISISSAMP
jgi:hypothetical protein